MQMVLLSCNIKLLNGFNMKDKYNILDKGKSTASQYVIRDGVTSIGAWAFESCGCLTEIHS